MKPNLGVRSILLEDQTFKLRCSQGVSGKVEGSCEEQEHSRLREQHVQRFRSVHTRERMIGQL